MAAEHGDQGRGILGRGHGAVPAVPLEKRLPRSPAGLALYSGHYGHVYTLHYGDFITVPCFSTSFVQQQTRGSHLSKHYFLAHSISKKTPGEPEIGLV